MTPRHSLSRNARLAVLLASLVLLAPVFAALRDAEPAQRTASLASTATTTDQPKPMFRLEGRMTGRNPFAGGTAGRAEFPATLYMRGKATRIDFRGPRGEPGLLLHDARTGQGWLADLGRGVAVPVDAAGLDDLVVDPQHPCGHLPYKCQAAPERFVAGASRRGWRYRNADGRGPAGTSNGEFWMDEQHGVILAYRGHMRGLQDVHAFEADSARFEALPEVLFDLPEVVTPDDVR